MMPDFQHPLIGYWLVAIAMLIVIGMVLSNSFQ